MRYTARSVSSATYPIQFSAPPRPTAIVLSVTPGSPAERADVRPGDRLLSVNGAVVPDILAYRRELERGAATLELERDDGPAYGFSVEWEDPGLEFTEVLFDGIHKCANKCDFCYVHQMPRGMRKSLYVMDDDYRLSYLYGSFVTLTNLADADVQRILDENLSPLYVSIHDANQERRAELMKWWRLKVKDQAATRIRDMLDRLSGIELYTQIVLVPGRNDGENLSETLEYLSSRENVQSVAVVPVGLTAHRTNLPQVRPFNADEARDALARVQVVQERMQAERGTRFVFPSDELYLLAGQPLPPEEAYEGFPMLENGVGMVRDFLSGGLPELPLSIEPRRVILGTGRLFAPILEEAVQPLRAIAGLDLEVRVVQNVTFGDPTTVAGLLTARCFKHAITPGEADLLLISPSCLKYGTELLLDDTTLGDLRDWLGMDARAGGTNLGELTAAILGWEGRPPIGPQFGESAHSVKEQQGN